MKINKKVVITAVIAVIAAVCGIIVYSVESSPKMRVGGIYNGITLRSVTEHSEAYAGYDIHNARDVEKQIAQNTSVLVSSMTFVSDNIGTVSLRIVSPDITESVRQAAENITADDKTDFIKKLSEALEVAFSKGVPGERNEPVFIEADMKYESGAWRIVPNKALFDAVTGNFRNIADETFSARVSEDK